MLATLLFGTLVLRNSYQASLYKFLQTQEPTQLLDTIDKLMQHKYNIYASSGTMGLLNFNISSLPDK